MEQNTGDDQSDDDYGSEQWFQRIADHQTERLGGAITFQAKTFIRGY